MFEQSLVWLQAGERGSFLGADRGAECRWQVLAGASRSSRQLACGLVRVHIAWSHDGRVIHGMQEVWGSNPHSSTQVRRLIRTLNR
jgi:hypothetical protein